MVESEASTARRRSHARTLVELNEGRIALLEADVNFKVVKDFIERVKATAVGQEVLQRLTPGEQVVKIVYDEMVSMLPVPPAHARRSLALDGSQPNARLTLTTPVAVALSVALLAGAFGYYAWRQIESVNPGSTSPAAARALAVPSTTPLPSPSPIRHAIVVVVRVTDTVWLNVIVDGKAQYSDSGHVFQPGAEVSFQGFDIKITSGKGAATFITIDDRPIVEVMPQPVAQVV